ncbi:hypothetical protein [Flavobacterium sedimenticola]|uniref:Uncharacterized protein n=1 Tax=Flavobacterium sedimenticola TaxID=3043286 RepID=A0ABT6XPZ2_9FLAO|nr:hypothetical protein [Flavobacterium sedimenticola]MDI9257131.1 hypothetical protein [Flavobacterium sedimenticola]
MKNLIAVFAFLLPLTVLAQNPCEIDVNVNDSLGTYKSTKQYMIFERSFAGNSTNIYFSLINSNGVLGVETQILQRSDEFIKALCFDANTKIYLQLNNGKIVTLLNANQESCGTLLRDDQNKNNRILTGTFAFAKENFEYLKSSPVTFMRIKFAGETIDYPFKTSFVSEMDKAKYEPENYFINYLKCIEN